MGAEDRRSWFTNLEHYRRRYAALKPGWEHATARFQRRIVACVTPTSHILDLGCGRGGVVERLGTTGQWIGCDPDWHSLKEHRVVGLWRSQAFSERLPFADGTFDIVIASWVLEHLPQPVKTWREITRVLRPGGRFFFLTPNRHHLIPRLGAWLAQLRKLQAPLVTAIYRRAAADTFPVYYRANAFEALERLGVETGLRLVQMEWVDDPSYFGWTESCFAFAARLGMLLPATWRVHLVGEYERL